MPRPFTIVHRPWITNSTSQTLTLPNVLLCDVYAYRDDDGKPWFSVVYRKANTTQAATYYQLADDMLVEADAFNLPHADSLIPMYWTRETHVIFRHAHAALRRLAAKSIEGVMVSTHYHYVVALDATPWPRGMVNGYKGYKARSKASPDSLNDTWQPLPDLL